MLQITERLLSVLIESTEFSFFFLDHIRNVLDGSHARSLVVAEQFDFRLLFLDSIFHRRNLRFRICSESLCSIVAFEGFVSPDLTCHEDFTMESKHHRDLLLFRGAGIYHASRFAFVFHEHGSFDACGIDEEVENHIVFAFQDTFDGREFGSIGHLVNRDVVSSTVEVDALNAQIVHATFFADLAQLIHVFRA